MAKTKMIKEAKNKVDTLQIELHKNELITFEISNQLENIKNDISKKNTNDALIFIIAEKLEKKSKVRNLFEKSKKLICGVALGYADYDDPSYQYRTDREPVESFTQWYR